MNKILPFLIIFLSSISFSQQLELPSIALSGISFEISATGFPDTLNEKKIEIYSEDSSFGLVIPLNNGSGKLEIDLPESGNYSVKDPESGNELGSLRAIPGFLSLIPPLLAILLALIFRQVIISILLGVFTGAVFVYDYNPFSGFIHVIDKYIIEALADTAHVQIIVFTFLFGGVVGLISKSGGTMGIANQLRKFAKNRKSGLLTAWLSGIIIFFDDYANCLIVGNLMRPMTDKLKISRAKLSFIVDATAANVASIVIISSWIGYEVGLIQDGLRAIGSDLNAYNLFLSTIPFRFYPIAMLFFVFWSSYTQKDFGPMLKSERNSSDINSYGSTEKSGKDLLSSAEMFGNEDKAKWYNGVVPILIIVFGTIAGLIYTGIGNLKAAGTTDYTIKEIIANSDSYLALLWSSFFACVVAGVMILSQKIMTLSETIDAWFLGIRSMLLAIILLTLAWSISAITYDLKTADFIIHLISDSIDPRFLPVIVFFACAATTFSTGASWGTMAIMMPIVIPLTANVTALHSYSSAESFLILNGVVSSVLAGCVFGDHCSPISDTTILSSMASDCDHIEHVRTQMPYAILVAALCMMFGDIPTAFGLHPVFSYLIIFGFIMFIVSFFGKRVDDDPEGGTVFSFDFITDSLQAVRNKIDKD